MLSIVANVVYVLIAISMVVLILLQRGAGANAGSGFGGGASATVFGARGSANFLSRSTAVLAALFFLLSLGMGMFLARSGVDTRPVDDLGVMSGVTAPAQETPAQPAATEPTGRTIQIGDVPPAEPAADKPAPTAAPAATPTDAEKPQPAAPEKDGKDGK